MSVLIFLSFLESEIVKLITFISASVSLIVFIVVGIKKSIRIFKIRKNNVSKENRNKILRIVLSGLLFISVILSLGIVVFNFYEALFSFVFGGMNLTAGLASLIFIDYSQVSNLSTIESLSITIIFIFSLVGIMRYITFCLNLIQSKYGDNKNHKSIKRSKFSLKEIHLIILDFMVTHKDTITENQIDEFSKYNLDFKVAFSELQDNDYISYPTVFTNNQPYMINTSRSTEIYKLVRDFKNDTEKK